MNTMEHRGYIGSAEIDVEGLALVGKLLHIRDTITYSASDIGGLRRAFEEAVDDYLSTCEELGDEPDQPCKGTFNVRVGPQRHRQLAIESRRSGVSINDYVCQALDAMLQGPLGQRRYPQVGDADSGGRHIGARPAGLLQAMEPRPGAAALVPARGTPKVKAARKRTSG